MKHHAGKSAFLFLLGAVLLAGASWASGEEAAPTAGKTKVFIFAGQSNMVGRSDPKKLPAEYQQPVPNVRVYANHAWRELAVPVRGDDGVGPEVSAARLLAAAFPGQKILLVKTAIGGTNLHTQWNPDRKESLYAKMIDDVKTATAGEEYEIVALFWAQGGADAKTEATAKAYGKNLADFIARARKDLGRPDLPFISSQGRVDASPALLAKFPFLAEVNCGKAEVAKTVPHTALVSTAGLTVLADGQHYDTAGTIEFGRRFVEALEREFHKTASAVSPN